MIRVVSLLNKAGCVAYLPCSDIAYRQKKKRPDSISPNMAQGTSPVRSREGETFDERASVNLTGLEDLSGFIRLRKPRFATLAALLSLQLMLDC